MIFGDLLSSRAIQVGLVFFVLVVSGSLLYSWHTFRTTENELERSNRFLRGTEQQKATRPAEKVNVPTENESPGLVNTPDETTDTPMPEETEALSNETDDLADAFLPDDFVSEEEAPAEEVPVSPYGFGPYPEVPADYPFTPFWLRYQKDPEIYDAKYTIDRLKGKELLSRIMVKAWTEGIRDFTGGSFEATTGKYYLHLPNTIYIEYGEPYENEDGTFTRPFAVVTSGNISLTPDQMQRGIAPTGVRVIEGGSYDPYEYLDLP